MKKIITIVVPSYNVDKYLSKNLDSFMVPSIMDCIEVLIVNDGSEDKTEQVAKEYCEKYPNTFRVINKINGGHGSTINVGIKEAVGTYFKVVDADDWLDSDAFLKLVNYLQSANIDVVITNYHLVDNNTLQHEKKEFTKCIYENIVQNEEFHWGQEEFYCMHSITYKTSILKSMPLEIDENCFYVDLEYAIYPLAFTSNIVFLNIFLYMYRIALSGQSVSYDGFIKHIDEHEKVLLSLIEYFEKYILEKKKNLEEYIAYQICSMARTNTNIYICNTNLKEREIRKKIKELDKKIKKNSPFIYKYIGKKLVRMSFLRITNYYGCSIIRIKNSIFK